MRCSGERDRDGFAEEGEGRKKREEGGKRADGEEEGKRGKESERAAGGDTFFCAGGIFSDFKSGMCVFSCRAPRFLTVSLLSVGYFAYPLSFLFQCPTVLVIVIMMDQGNHSG